MQRVSPFTDLAQAISDLDNGGRFYNILSQARDGLIAPGELARAAGVLSAGWKAVLHFQLATRRLSEADRAALFDRLEAGVQKTLTAFRAIEIHQPPSGFEQRDRIAIVTGYPRAATDFAGEALLPTRHSAFGWVPLADRMDVWYVFEGPRTDSDPVVAAASRQIPMSPDTRLTFGGILRPLQWAGRYSLFLEAHLFSAAGEDADSRR